MKTTSNKSVPLLLLGIAGCLALLPWQRWLGGAPAHEERLTERIAQYAGLRQQEDWVSVYGLMDLRDRRAVPLPRFLTLYGLGAVKTVSIKEKSRQVDVGLGTANVVLTLEGELRLEKLPPNVRRSLQPQDPQQLRQTGDFATEWSWADGDWWLRMDKEALTGRTADGKEIAPAANQVVDPAQVPGKK